jgi:hypothetical protein
MLDSVRLGVIFPLLANLPHDASDSVAALYEALVYISDTVAQSVTWKARVLSTGFLLLNSTARAYHTYAVSLLLSNFRRLCLGQLPPAELALVEEKHYLSQTTIP